MKTVRQIEQIPEGVRRTTGERLSRFGRLHALLEEHRAEWTRAHADQWVAVGVGGIEATAATQDDLLGIVERDRVVNGDLVVELREVNPPRLAL